MSSSADRIVNDAVSDPTVIPVITKPIRVQIIEYIRPGIVTGARSPYLKRLKYKLKSVKFK